MLRAMGKTFADVLREARRARKITQAQVAAAFGITRPAVGQWESGDTSPETDKLSALSEMLGFDLASALQGSLVLSDRESAGHAQSASAMPALGNARLMFDQAPVDTAAFKGPRNVPVYGTGAGGQGGDFRLNGQIIDHAPRPPGIANRRDVYVVYVVGDSVAPKYEDGDPIYIDPHRRPSPRDYVFVELWGPSEDEPGDALIKRLVGRNGGNLILEQHNPAGQIEPIPEKTVKRVHRVIPWPELLGV